MVELPEPMNECGVERYLSAGYGCNSPVDMNNCANGVFEGKTQDSSSSGWIKGNGGKSSVFYSYNNTGSSNTGNNSNYSYSDGNSNTGNNSNYSYGDGNSNTGGNGGNNAGILSGIITGSNTPGLIIPGILPSMPNTGNNIPNSGISIVKVPSLINEPPPITPLISKPVILKKKTPVTPIGFQPPKLVAKVVTVRVPQFKTVFINHPAVTFEKPPVTTTYTMPPKVVVETQPPVVLALPPVTMTSTAPAKTFIETIPAETVTKPAITLTMTERYTMPPVTLSYPPSTLVVVSTSVPPPLVFTRSVIIYATTTVQNQPVTITYFVERPLARFLNDT
jgi:hypothetical protein